MRFSTRYPDFATIERHIQHARLERAVAISHMLAAAGDAAVKGFKRLAARFDKGLAEQDRRAILKQPVPRY